MPGFAIGNDIDPNGPSPVMEVARSHRWTVFVQDPNLTGISAYARSVSEPSLEFDKMVMHHRQNEVYIPGKYRWGTINLQVYEWVDGDENKGAELFRYWWSHIVSDTKYNALNPLNSLKRSVKIQLEDGQQNVVYSYNLSGAWPQKVDGSGFDYTSSDLKTKTVTLVFDACREEPLL